MMNNYQKIAAEINALVGGKENVASITHCMTRLRLTLVDSTKADTNAISEIDGVIRVVEEDEKLHVVLGPGVVNKVHDFFVAN